MIMTAAAAESFDSQADDDLFAHARAAARSCPVADLPPQSCLRIPLVRQALLDETFRARPRRIDTSWAHAKVIDRQVFGFNPFVSTFFYGRNSPFAEWLADPVNLARELNEFDSLIQELCYFAHDYLHAWCHNAIKALLPEFGAGAAPLTQENLETFAFFQLVSEACATVGLDYWYLSCVDLGQVVDIGSPLSNFAVQYREADLGREYRRFNPEFSVQCPEFFGYLVRCYCEGGWGFSWGDQIRSEKLRRWLTHEIDYGSNQREYTRAWMAFMSAGRASVSQCIGNNGPVAYDVARFGGTISRIGELLWEKVKHDVSHDLGSISPFACAWMAEDPASTCDFRFSNLATVGDEALTRQAIESVAPVNFDYFFCQYVSQFHRRGTSADIIRNLPLLRQSRDPALLRTVFANQPRVAPVGNECPVLLFLN